MVVKNQSERPNFHIESLPMNRTRRPWVTRATSGVSMLERWTGRRMNAPSVGTLSRPSTLTRQNSRQNPAMTNLTKA